MRGSLASVTSASNAKQGGVSMRPRPVFLCASSFQQPFKFPLRVNNTGHCYQFFAFVHPIKHDVVLHQPLPILMLQRPDGGVGGICVRKSQDAVPRLNQLHSQPLRRCWITKLPADIPHNIHHVLAGSRQVLQLIQPAPLQWPLASPAGLLLRSNAGLSARPRAPLPGA